MGNKNGAPEKEGKRLVDGVRERRQVEERGKSITACFNTWNACDFEVDKGSQGRVAGEKRCFRLFFAEISQMGY